MKLWAKIFIAMALGLALGLSLGENAVILKPVGTAFLSLLSMIIVPLVFSSITAGVTSIKDPKKLGRLGLRAMFYYLSTTLIAVSLGIGFAYLFSPGVGLGLTATEVITGKAPDSIMDVILSMIPKNPFAALVSGNVVQVIIFAIFLGFGIIFAGDKGKPVSSFFESLAEVMYKVTNIVMQVSPIGVFAIMAWISGAFGLEVILPLLKFIAVYYAACILFAIVVFGTILMVFAGLKPMPFFKGMRDATIMAFSTGSSSATLPVTMRCAQENLGISKNLAGFALPMGTAFNMNGTVLFQGMSAVFIAQAYGVVLDFNALGMIVLTATLASLGTAGIPGSGLIMLSAVLSSVGLPLEGIAILAGVDRLRDMIGTVLNVLGDTVVAVALAKHEGEIDVNCYYQDAMVMAEEN